MLRLALGMLLFIGTLFGVSTYFSADTDLLLKTGAAEVNCRLGWTVNCRDSADKLAGVSEQTSIRLHTYNCFKNADGASCWSNAQTFQRFGHMDTALKFMAEACRQSEADSCFESVGLAIELGGGRTPQSLPVENPAGQGAVDGVEPVRDETKLYFTAVQSAVLGCKQGDARACVMRAQLVDEKTDPAGHTAALHRGCYELHNSKACLEFSESLERQGQKEQARQAAAQCNGEGNCEI